MSASSTPSAHPDPASPVRDNPADPVAALREHTAALLRLAAVQEHSTGVEERRLRATVQFDRFLYVVGPAAMLFVGILVAYIVGWIK